MSTFDSRLDHLLAGYVLGDLQEDELKQLRQALDSDPQLQVQLDELQVTLQLLPLALPADAVPPMRLRRRMLASQSGSRIRRFWPFPSPRLHLQPSAVGMAVLALALSVLGVRVLQLQSQMAMIQIKSSPTSLADAYSQGDRRLLLLKSSNQQQPALSGKLHVTPDLDYNMLAIRGLPAPPPAHVYRLWATTNGMTKGCVRFVPRADGTVSMPIPSHPTTEAQALSVTLEPLVPDGSVPKGPRLLTSV